MPNISVFDSTAVTDSVGPGFVLVSHTGAAGTGSAATTSGINTSGATLLIVSVASWHNTGVPSVSDSKGNSWTQLTSYIGGSNGTRQTLYYCASPKVGPSHTFTASISGGFPSITVQAWSGAAVSPFDQQNGNSSSSASTLQPGSITPSQNNELVVSGICVGTLVTLAVDSGLVITDQIGYGGANNFGGGLAYWIESVAAAINPIWSWGGTSMDVSASIASFEPASPALELIDNVSVSDSTAVSDSVVCIIVDSLFVDDSTAVTDAVSVESFDLVSVSESTAVSDTLTLTVSNPVISVFDSTAVTDVSHFPIINNLLGVDSTAVTDQFYMDRPNDRCAGFDTLYYGTAPGLFEYSGVLYQLTESLIGVDSNFDPIQSLIMKASSDHGQTWSQAAIFGGTTGYYFGSMASDLVGTKLYFVFNPFDSLSFAYFDFTTLTFNAISVSGAPFTLGNIYLEVLDANHIFIVLGAVTVGEIVSGVYTSIGSISPSGAYGNFNIEAVILGSSDVLHIFYTATFAGGSLGPSDLWYFNVNAGVLSTPVRVKSSYSNGNPGFVGSSAGSPLQVGATIYFSFYDFLTQSLVMLYFSDIANPTFNLGVIDPSWPLAVSSNNGSGSGISVLAYYGTTLYCFYSNYADNGTDGDGKVYYRLSTNLGITWSALYQTGQHIDPSTLSPAPIWQPNVIQVVGGGNPVNSPLITTWEQA
jgi:hypothetical protein